MSSKKHAPDSRQLSLDIEPTSPATNAAPSPAGHKSPSAWAPSAELAWQAPEAPWDALLLAAELNHTDLINSLLSLPIDWNMKASEPGTRTLRGLNKQDEGKTALHLLLRQRSSQSWNPDGFETDALQAQRQALELARRGADFIGLSNDQQSALAVAATHQRKEFIQGLAGHPDFIYERVKSLRVGGFNPAAPVKDHRPSLLGHLIRTDQEEAATALITQAGWPVNERDNQGQLPLGYCRHARMTAALLKLGADPALEDADGVNAMAHAQGAENTQERDKMIGLLAQALRKGAAKNDPVLMAQLQAENLPALLEAAENSPKSSLSKLISAFKFDIRSVKDPRTGATPLMAALKGGRLSSAAYLLEAGASINAQDGQGLSAAAYLLLGRAASGSPAGMAKALYQKAEPLIQWDLTDPQGRPLSFQPFLIKPNDDPEALKTALERVIAASSERGAPLRGARSEPLMSVFAPALIETKRDWQFYEHARKALGETLKIKQLDGVDHVLKAALVKYAQTGSSSYSYGAGSSREFFSQIDTLIKQGAITPESLPACTDYFNAAPEAKRAAMAESLPGLHAFLELCALRQEQAPAAQGARKNGPRL